MDVLLARIKSRCVVTAEGCWIWQGTYLASTPILQSQEGPKQVSRLIACHIYGLKYEQTGQAKQICFNPECVCPDHVLVPGHQLKTEKELPKEPEPQWNPTPAERLAKKRGLRIPLKERLKIQHLRNDLGMSVMQIGAITKRPYSNIEAVLKEGEGK